MSISICVSGCKSNRASHDGHNRNKNCGEHPSLKTGTTHTQTSALTQTSVSKHACPLYCTATNELMSKTEGVSEFSCKTRLCHFFETPLSTQVIFGVTTNDFAAVQFALPFAPTWTVVSAKSITVAFSSVKNTVNSNDSGSSVGFVTTPDAPHPEVFLPPRPTAPRAPRSSVFVPSVGRPLHPPTPGGTPGTVTVGDGE